MLHAAARMYLILGQNPPRESGYAASTVPRVKHLIIYSGKQPWTAVGEVGQAIRARGLKEERDIPRMECPLLELWRCPDPGGEENLAVLLGRLQRCDNPETLRAAAEPLKNWPPSESQGALGRAFAAWISEVLIPNLGVPDAVKSYRLGAALSDSLAADRAPGRSSRFRDGVGLPCRPVAIGFVLGPVLEGVMLQQLGRDVPRHLGRPRVQFEPGSPGLAGLQLVKADPQRVHLARQLAQIRRDTKAPRRLRRVVGQFQPDRQRRHCQGHGLTHNERQARQQRQRRAR